MRVVLAFARTYPRQTLAVLLALSVAGAVEGVSLTALLPALSAATRDGAAPETGVGGLVVQGLRRLGVHPDVTSLLLVLVLGTALTSLIGLGAKRQVGYTVAQVATDLRLELLRSLLAARWEYYIRQPIGRLANAMSFEADAAARSYLNAASMTAAAVQAGAYVWVAMLVSWQATVVYVAAAVVIAVLLQGLVRVTRRAGKKQTKMMSRLMAGLTDSLQSVKPLKAMARENLADRVLVAKTLELNTALRRQIISKEGRRALQQPLLMALVAVGAWGGLVIWELPMAQVLMLVLLLAKVLGSFGRVQEAYQDLVTSESAYWSLRRALDEARREPEAQGGGLAPHFARELHLDAVDFAYGRNPVLRDCSLAIPFGSLTTLTGHSGAGKTTVLDLIVGLVRPVDGSIRVDGVDLADVDLRGWRRLIGYVPQENLLLHDSVLRNVTLDDPEVGVADVEFALRAAGAWDFVTRLPEGVHTPVGERGSRLSGGQRQRITIARALAHRPRLLILDEATTALDPATESALCATLDRLRGSVTMLTISHQPALVATADRVYRIEKGRAFLEADRPDLRERERRGAAPPG